MNQLVALEDLHGVVLDEAEQQLLYNVEVLGLSIRRAGAMAGVADPNKVLQRTDVAAAREKLRSALKERVNITREDVVAGLKGAVDQAVIYGDTMAQIAGWREIAKILGYDKTPNVNVHIQGTLDQVQRQMRGMTVDELLKASGQTDLVDADFYRVDSDAA